MKISGEIVSFEISRKICFNFKKRISSQDMVCPWTYHNYINPNSAFVNTDVDENVLMVLRGELAEMLVLIAPQI
jgi:hypothetical protein